MKLEPTSFTFTRRAAVRVRRLVIVACLFMAASGSVLADEPLPTEPEPDKETAEKKCEWACERWTKMCNVDPRGVYKCRRTCAKFGEICE
jgi:hypothetical protein